MVAGHEKDKGRSRVDADGDNPDMDTRSLGSVGSVESVIQKGMMWDRCRLRGECWTGPRRQRPTHFLIRAHDAMNTGLEYGRLHLLGVSAAVVCTTCGASEVFCAGRTAGEG